MNKQVLLVSYFAPPLINAESILVWKTARELSRFFGVHLVTSKLHRTSPADESMVLPGVQVYSNSTYKPQNRLLGKFADKTIGLAVDEHYLWARFGSSLPIHCDLIYSRSHPGASHILAHKLKNMLQKPWIAQFSDPWTSNPYHKGHTRLRRATDCVWEKRVVQDADFLVFPTEEIADMYDVAYKPVGIRNKSIVLPHHFMPDLYPVTRPERTASGDTVSFAYFGDFYGVRSPQPFIDALRTVAVKSPDIVNRISVHFYGNVESKFVDVVTQSPVPITHRRVSYFESLNRMAMTDVLLLIDAPSETGVNPFLASKLIDYLGAGRRILGITDVRGTSANVLRKYGHEVISPHDTHAIAEAVKRSVSSQAHVFNPPEEFTTQNVVGRLAAIMTDLMR